MKKTSASTWLLATLQQAAEAAGDRATARVYAARLLAMSASSDGERAELANARRLVSAR